MSLSIAFAGPLLKKVNAESGGAHLVGDSSSGKTTLIEGACSVFGGETFMRSWKTTANGMEGVASLFNDCLLALDEISEADPRDVGTIIYALGNGRGKQRAGRSGSARKIARWTCTVFSSGERTIETTMREGGQKTKAGQGIRLLNIPAKATFGVWDHLHGFKTGSAMSDHIKSAVKSHHGHAGRDFIAQLAHSTDDFGELFQDIKALFSCRDGQEKRAASRFALYSLAGELATAWGITGWTKGEAHSAAVEMFEVWKSYRGGGNTEEKQITQSLIDFIDSHGSSRFESVVGDHPHVVIRDRAGWRDGSNQYFFTSSGLKEATKGFDFKRVLEVLEVKELLGSTSQNERAIQKKFGGENKKVYHIVPPEDATDD